MVAFCQNVGLAVILFLYVWSDPNKIKGKFVMLCVHVYGPDVADPKCLYLCVYVTKANSSLPLVLHDDLAFDVNCAAKDESPNVFVYI